MSAHRLPDGSDYDERFDKIETLLAPQRGEKALGRPPMRAGRPGSYRVPAGGG